MNGENTVLKHKQKDKIDRTPNFLLNTLFIYTGITLFTDYEHYSSALSLIARFVKPNLILLHYSQIEFNQDFVFGISLYFAITIGRICSTRTW